MRSSLDNSRLRDCVFAHGNKLGSLSKTITATFTIAATAPPYIVLSAASAQNVVLPAALRGALFWITASGAGALTVQNPALATVGIVGAGQSAQFLSDGTSWFPSVGGSAPVVGGVAAGYKIARGVDAVTGTLTKATGLATVVAVTASSQDDMDGVSLAAVSATVGDQAGAPAAGSVILKAWKVTATGNATLIAATAAKNINWIAVGT